MSLVKVQNLLENAGYVVNEPSAQELSIEVESNMTDFYHQAVFRRSALPGRDIEVRISLPEIGPVLKDPQTICQHLAQAEPQLLFRFDRKTSRIMVIYFLDSADFNRSMEHLMRSCDAVAQLLMCAVTGFRTVTNNELNLAARVPLGFC